MRVRCQAKQCEAMYDLSFDRLGRMVGHCPACARRRAGQCVSCAQPVDGARGKAKYCRPCRAVAHRYYVKKSRMQDIVAYNKRAAERVARRRAIARGDRPVLDQKTIGTIRGLARAKALSPERRKEIAAKASKVRWQKYYQREMLKRMREANL